MTEPTPPPVPPYGSLPAPGSAPAPGSVPASGTQVPPAYQAPPGAYGVPVGGYQAPVGGYSVPPATPPASAAMGSIALVLALVAAVVVPVVGGVLGYQIGVLVPAADFANDAAATQLSLLTPARTQVLWAEVAFWSGTVLGVTAIVLGIIAAAKRRGRGRGIAAIVLAALGPVLFFGATLVLLGVGAAAGMLPAA